MRISVFASYPRPHVMRQQLFAEKLMLYLRQRGMEPRTLGVTDYDMDAPLQAIRRLMLESNGLLTIAFRRTFVMESRVRADADIDNITESKISNMWLTSPYCQIEPAMAYQLGLPILILREKGVVAEGLLEKGVTGMYMPEFSLDDLNFDFFQSLEWSDVIGKWEGFVRAVVGAKGKPPRLY